MAEPARASFDPVDTSFDPNEFSARDDVESPSLSSGNALARFEFEPGRSSKDGTKVLMVEWEDDATTAGVVGDWEISWEGKRTVLPARDQAAAAAARVESEEAPVNRLYFLIGPGVAVPSTVQLRKGSAVSWKTNPLPAIFSPELGATARQAGKKGVLHTIWAKKRLQVLQKEIEEEGKDNVEGIGYEMAAAEKEWIEQNFGVVARPSHILVPGAGALSSANFANTPSSPRSPGGGRLMDKLRGLRIGTTAEDLAGGSSRGADAAAFADNHPANPLSPETSDVAVSGFGSFAALKGTPAPGTTGSRGPAPQPRKIAAQRPPDAVLAAQQRQEAGMGSLNAFANGGGGGGGESLGVSAIAPPAPAAASNLTAGDSAAGDRDDLFALPMSPRSPEMTKSPFSFGAQDTMRYSREEKA